MAQRVGIEAEHLPLLQGQVLRAPLAFARPLLTALTLALLSGSVPASDDLDAPTRDWRNGPVRYLLTRAEDQAYKQPHTRQEREAFIRAFWARRDPTPGTLRNEFREQFVDRVLASEGLRRYQDVSRAQWLTDMGKIFILLGPPISEDHQQTSGSTRDVVVWTYDRAPGVRARNFALAFVADESGELRLSESPSLDMSTIQGLDPHTPLPFFEGPVAHVLRPGDASYLAGRSDADAGGQSPAAAYGAPDPRAVMANVIEVLLASAYGNANIFYDLNRFVSDQGGRINLGPYQVMVADAILGDPFMSALGSPTLETDLGRLSGIATVQAEAMDAARTAVAIKTSFQPLRVDLRTDFYAASDGTTYAAFTLAPGAGGPAGDGRWLPFGGLVSLDDPEVEYSFSTGAEFAAAGEDAPGTFQTGLGIDPGRYRALFGLHDLASGRIGYQQVDLDVPDLHRPALTLSSLTLARSIAPVAAAQTTPWKLAYVFGGLRVVPRPDPTLRNGEEFHLFYQVYGTAADAEGRTDLALRYQFSRQDGESWVEMGPALERRGTSAVQTLSFPLQQWPAGTYRLAVEVRDLLSDVVAAGDLVFRVAAD